MHAGLSKIGKRSRPMCEELVEVGTIFREGGLGLVRGTQDKRCGTSKD